MLGMKRGFTVIQLVVAMMVAGLLLMAVAIMVAQRTWRDNQRRSDLVQINALIERYAESHASRYPKTKDAEDPSSALKMQFAQLGLKDPRSDKYYVLGSNFGPCDSGADPQHQGVGYISYKRPGTNAPYDLRICLEWGEYYIEN